MTRAIRCPELVEQELPGFNMKDHCNSDGYWKFEVRLLSALEAKGWTVERGFDQVNIFVRHATLINPSGEKITAIHG